MQKRYTIETGIFGQYFKDNGTNEDMPLEDVVYVLNVCERYKDKNEKLIKCLELLYPYLETDSDSPDEWNDGCKMANKILRG